MSGSIFSDKSAEPTESMLAESLGNCYKLWLEIKRLLETEYGELVEVWKFYSSSSGWLLKLLRKKRNLFFFIPQEKYFKITFVFGDKAVSVIEQSSLPQAIIKELQNAKKYVEGRGLTIEVRSRKDVENVVKLVKIELDN